MFSVTDQFIFYYQYSNTARAHPVFLLVFNSYLKSIPWCFLTKKTNVCCPQLTLNRPDFFLPIDMTANSPLILLSKNQQTSWMSELTNQYSLFNKAMYSNEGIVTTKTDYLFLDMFQTIWMFMLQYRNKNKLSFPLSRSPHTLMKLFLPEPLEDVSWMISPALGFKGASLGFRCLPPKNR